MNDLNISSKKLNSRRVNSYLLWLQVKNLLSVGFFTTIVAVFLSITMFYRFYDLDNPSGNSVKTVQQSNIKDLSTQKN